MDFPVCECRFYLLTPKGWSKFQLRSNYSVPALWLRRVIPGALLLMRFYQFVLGELLYFLVFSNKKTRRIMQWVGYSNFNK